MFSHGGDILGAILETGADKNEIIDFSSNINPFGMPQSVKKALIENINEAEGYPDPFCRKLKEEISKYERVGSENIICGNGAAELIYSFMYGLSPKKVLIPVPSFFEYEKAAKASGSEIEYYFCRESDGFNLTDGFLREISDDIDLIILCSPSNPVGNIIPRKLIIDILRICLDRNIILLLDECFIDFADSREENTLVPYISEYKNLIILKSFTKLYSAAGVRLGYAMCGNEDILNSAENARQPWSVGTLAQEAGIAAVRDRDYRNFVISKNRAERERFKNKIEKTGVTVFGSDANFIFFKADGVSDLRERMLKYDILIRSCGNYTGLGDEYYRAAVRKSEENDRFLEALREVLK